MERRCKKEKVLEWLPTSRVGCNIIQLECQITPYCDVSDSSEVLVAQKTCDVIMLTEEVVCGKSFCSQFFHFFKTFDVAGEGHSEYAKESYH